MSTQLAAQSVVPASLANGVSVLLVGGDHLAVGVAAELTNSPLQCHAAQSLSEEELLENDVVLVANRLELRRLESVVKSIEARGIKPPPIVVMGVPAAPSFGSNTTLDAAFVMPTGDDETVARQLIRCVGVTLAKRRSVPPEGGSRVNSRRGHAFSPSAAPKDAATVGAAVHALTTLNSPSSGVRGSASNLPGPPRLPQALLPPEVVPTPMASLRPNASRSLMPQRMVIEGSRWVILDDDVVRAHAVATCLTRCGARVELAGLPLTGYRSGAIRALDATGILLSESLLKNSGGLIRRFEDDSRLRSVPLVPVRWKAVFDESTATVDEEALKLLLLPHWQREAELVERLISGEEQDVTALGAPKVLKAAARAGGQMQLEFKAERRWVLQLRGGDLMAVTEDGNACPSHALGASLDQVIRLARGTVSVSPVSSLLRERVLGSVEKVLEIHAEHGGPLPADLRLPWHERLPESAQRVLRRFRSWIRPLSSLAIQLWRRYPNTISLVAGVLVSALVAVVALSAHSGQPAPTAAPPPAQPDGPATPNAAVATRPQASPPGAATEASAGASAAPAAVPAAKATVTTPPPVSVPTPSGELPQGCGRWLSSKSSTKLQPAQAGPAMRLAQRAIVRGDMDKAQELMCLSVAMDPTGPGVAGLVRFYFTQENLDAATRWSEWAHAQQPSNPEIKLLLADVRNRQGRVDEGRALLHDAMNLSAADAKVLQQVARKYTGSGFKALRALDAGQAERLFRRAAALDASNAEARAGLAHVFLRQGNVRQALEQAQAAAKLSPVNFEVQLALGDAYAENKQVDQAKKAWLEAARMRPSSREARRRLGL